VPSLPTHAVAALGIGACFYRPEIPKGIWVIGAVCSIVPDLDVIGFRFGIRYGDFWGHRGFAHSLFFAALLALVIVVLGFRHGVTEMHALTLWLYLFLATASHGLLDALTDGALGIALFSPSTTTVTSFRGLRFGFRQLEWGDSSAPVASQSCRANSCGFGFPPYCWRFPSSSCGCTFLGEGFL